MRFSTPLNLLLLQSLLASAEDCCTPKAFCQQDFKDLGEKYLALWGGKYELAEEIIDPEFRLFADRSPFGPQGKSIPINVNSREEFVKFIKDARAGWDEYIFEIRQSVGHDFSTALRWTLHGVFEGDSQFLPGVTLGRGAPIVFNGTDFLTLNTCTGLIKDVASSQDQIDLYFQLQLESIPT